MFIHILYSFNYFLFVHLNLWCFNNIMTLLLWNMDKIKEIYFIFISVYDIYRSGKVRRPAASWSRSPRFLPLATGHDESEPECGYGVKWWYRYVPHVPPIAQSQNVRLSCRPAVNKPTKASLLSRPSCRRFSALHSVNPTCHAHASRPSGPGPKCIRVATHTTRFVILYPCPFNVEVVHVGTRRESVRQGATKKVSVNHFESLQLFWKFCKSFKFTKVKLIILFV